MGAVGPGNQSGTWDPGQDQQLIHRQVDLPLLQITTAEASGLLLRGGEWRCDPVFPVRESWAPTQPYQCVTLGNCSSSQNLISSSENGIEDNTS